MKYHTYKRPLGALLAACALWAGPAMAEPVRIGIANYGEHPQLNQTVDGFKAALAEDGYVEGKQVVYSESHTNFDASLVPQMISKLQGERLALLFTITTPVSQTAKNMLKDTDIPVVFSVVTDPVAAKLVPSWDQGDAKMTGASDLQDVKTIMAFIHEFLPKAKRIGIPFNPGESNDVAIIDKFKAEAAAGQFQIVEIGIDNANDIQPRIAAAIPQIDVIYVPGSNLIQPAVASVAAVAREAGIPIINADDGAVREGIVPASIAVNYVQVGMNAGHIAAKILGGTSAQAIPTTLPASQDHIKIISRRALEAYKITLPESLANCDCLVD